MRLKATVASYTGLLAVLLILTSATVGPLRSKYQISAYSGTIEGYLNHVEKEVGVQFSYNPNLIPVDSIIQAQSVSGRLLSALDVLFDDKMDYIESGQYVIIKPINKPKSKKATTPTESKYIITGKVVNSVTGEVVSQAVIYDQERLISTVTDQKGEYALTVSARNDFIPLSISKESFLDTIIIIEPIAEKDLVIDLRPQRAPILLDQPQVQKLQKNKVQSVRLAKLVVPSSTFQESNHLGIVNHRLAQVSLLPNMGTNRRLGATVENRVSINILAGYSGAVNGFELGGLVNVTRQDVKGIQVAGFGNVTGGKVEGIQISGFFNNNQGSIHGIQVAGFQNVVMDTVKGAQVAGFVNVLKGKMDGFQLAGFTNITTKDVEGIQLAGFTNVALGDVDLLQLSGFGNWGGNVGGGQLAGFMNSAWGNVGGGQMAGFTNIAKGNVGGWQLSGFSNSAGGNVNGGQLSGFINMADSVKALQMSGFANVATGSVGGWQLTGFGNLAIGKVSGGQISGFVNIADSVEALQLAGFMNLSGGEIRGAQISGFLNVARAVKGVQFGAFNFAHEAEGIPIGLLSFVWKGYHSLGVNASEVAPFDITFKTGVKRFYNIISVMSSPYREQSFVGLGYGIGSLRNLGKRTGIAGEIQSYQIKSSFDSSIEFNLLTEARLLFSYDLSSHFHLTAGPHFSYHIRDDLPNNEPGLLGSGEGNVLGDTEWNSWLGGNVGLSLSF